MVEQFEDQNHIQLNLLSNLIAFPVVTSLTATGKAGLDTVLEIRNEIIRLYQAKDYPSAYLMLRNLYNQHRDTNSEPNLDAVFIEYGQQRHLLRELILEFDNMIPEEANTLLSKHDSSDDEGDIEYLSERGLYTSYSLD